MKFSLPLKLGILVVVVFAIVITWMISYPHIYIRYYTSQLESADKAKRWNAFCALIKKGDRGREVLGKYCAQNTDAKFGKETSGVRIKLRSENPVQKLQTSYSPNRYSDKFGFKISFINLNNRSLTFRYPRDKWGEIESLIIGPQDSSSFAGPFLRYPLLLIGPGNANDIAMTDRLIVGCGIGGPGVYRLRIMMNIIEPGKPEGEHQIKSNWICIAALPSDKPARPAKEIKY